ncbi:hypothetical protein DXT88_19430 [Herbaspirillum lusitanum]|nr:hypothetical protein [Herbaspirillum lusitanum]
MRALYERGAMRVQPASYYAAPSHNGAVRDDEQTLPLSLYLTRAELMKVVRNPQDVPDDVGGQRLDIVHKSQTDYWLYCVTTAVEPRLFVDFHADACVIIKDRAKFEQLITSHSARNFPATTCFHGDVTYVDPLSPTSVIIDVPMSKHFRYGYQKEYRFIWRPAGPANNLSYIDLEVGSLEGIAEIVVV